MSASIGEHMRCPEGTLINGRYRVLKECGCGNFAKVYKCVDTRNPEAAPVAVKVLKREYATDASFELEILKTLRTKAHGRKVVQMLDHFQVNNYPCFVFKLAGPTLRARKFGISKGCVTVNDVRRLAQDLIGSLAFLHHELRMIHTDLKPENILLEEAEPGADGIGNGWTIADFGSASFYRPERPDSDLISTRPYRAPEVVLGMPWSPKADVWSLACILFEVYYGGRLFEVHDDHEHLNKFEQRLGKLPVTFTRPSKLFRRFFDDAGSINRRPTTPVSRSMLEILRAEPELHDMLRQMLHFDPTQRISAQEAMQHPFMTGAPRRSVSTRDDAAAGSNSNVSAPTSSSSNAVPSSAALMSKAMMMGAAASSAAAAAAYPTDKENAAQQMGAANNNNVQCIPGTSIPLPPSTYGAAGGPTLGEQAKAKWSQALDRPAAGVPSARTNTGVVGPSTRKLF